MTLSRLKPNDDNANDIRAMPTAPAAHEPSPRSRPSRVSIRIASDRATIRPMFTHRVHYGAPKPVGHRAFIEPKMGER